MSNPARFHDCAAAAEADKRTQQAWTGHPQRLVVDNSTDFGTKVHRVLAPICEALAIPAPKLLTKVMLVHDLPRSAIPVPVQELELTIIALPSSTPLSQSSDLHEAAHQTAHAAAAAADMQRKRARARSRSMDGSEDEAGGGDIGAGVSPATVGAPRVSLIRRLHGGSFAYVRREQHLLRSRARAVSGSSGGLAASATAGGGSTGAGAGASAGASSGNGSSGGAGGGAQSPGGAAPVRLVLSPTSAAVLSAPHNPEMVTITKQRPIMEREYLDTLHSSDCGVPVDERVWCFHVDGRLFTLKRFGRMAALGVLKLEVEVRARVHAHAMRCDAAHASRPDGHTPHTAVLVPLDTSLRVG